MPPEPPPPPPPPPPYDARIEYLESSGTQYIDTGRYAEGVDITRLRMKYSGFRDRLFTIGCASGLANRAFQYANGGSGTRWGKYFFAYDGAANYTSYDCPNDEEIHVADIGEVFIVDDVLLWNTRAQTDFVTDRTIWLYRENRSDTRYRFGYMRIYELQIYERGVLVMDLIPVRIDDVGYMYDQVTGELLGNSGSGSFILGPDI